MKGISQTPTLCATLYHEETRKVFNDVTVTLRNALYEVPEVLIGKSIPIAYDSHQPIKWLLISCKGESYGEERLVESCANRQKSLGKTLLGRAVSESLMVDYLC
jgi:hypothetical protein